MPIESPYIAACMFAEKEPSRGESELRLLVKQLEDVEKDKYRKGPKTRKRKRLWWFRRASSS